MTSGSLLGNRVPMASLMQVLAVAEYLNFHHAAKRLGVSQSSVSTRIKALEDDLGILLFERRHRGVRLTEAGRIFVAEVAAGIEHLDHAIKTAGVIADGIVGHLGIGLHSSIAGEGVTLTTEAASHVPFPGVVFRQIADETERAKFSAVWSPRNSSPALTNLLDLATGMSRHR